MIDRTPKPCHHKEADHQHGTYHAYIFDRCRCLPCALAHGEYRIDLRRRNRRGITRFVDAAPVRAHVLAIRAAGWGVPRIIAESGVSSGSLQRLLYRGANSRPSQLVSVTVRDKIMALPIPEPVDAHRVPSIGVRRRLQALANLGWTSKELAVRAGLYVDTLNRAARQDRCRWDTLKACIAVYNQVWDKPAPTNTTGQRITAARMRNMAQRKGWPPPMAWDDDTIDQPDAKPNLTGEAGSRMELYLSGLSDAAIAREENVTVDAIRVWRRRNGLAANYKTRGRHVA